MAVARGWCYWTGGILPSAKAQTLAAKLDARFGGLIGHSLTANAADRRKKLHRPRPRMLLAETRSGDIAWYLLCDRPDLPGETLADAREKRSRIHFAERYELVRVNKPRAIGGGQNWTWRYTPKVYDQHVADGCRYAAHESPKQAQALINFLATDPGYSGLRTQRAQLFQRMTRIRQRQKPGRKTLQIPHLPVAVLTRLQKKPSNPIDNVTQ